MGLFAAALSLTAFPTVCTASGAAAVFFMRRPPSARSQRMMLGFAAGVMLAASVWSLLLPAIGRAAAGPFPAWVPPAAGLCIGAFGLLCLEQLAGGLLAGGGGHSGRIVLAVTLHNLPEGMAIGVGFSHADMAVGLPLTTAIALQDVPEGLAVALALRSAGFAPSFAVLVAIVSGVLEPVGALLGVGLSSGLALAYPIGLGLAAGAMLFVVSHEVIPETHRNGHQTPATVGLMLGFALMMVLDTTLG